MNFIRYNPDTGNITGIGYMDPEHVQREIDKGEPTLFIDHEFDRLQFKVNLTTKQIEPK
jgi:hypothetical protein